jgi:metal-responsive CopG/Arc/MetJ family transcriptional regulator
MASRDRINITIDRKTLRLADRAARRQKTSRSEFFRAAVREMARQQERESEDVAGRVRQRAAVEGMRQLARKAGNWPAVELLHAWRYRSQRNEK